MKHPTSSAHRLLAALLALVISAPLYAEEPVNYLEGPLTIIVPRGQGGGSHQLSKKMGAALSDITGVEVTLKNIPGDSGQQAVRDFMALPHDGYTLLQHVDDLPSAFAKGELTFDPTSDLVPVAVVQITFSQLYIRNIEKRFSDWNGFLQYARAHPGELKVSLVGHEGAMESLLLEMLSHRASMEVQHTSYNKPSERYMSLIKGDVDALIEQPGDVRPFLDRKMIRPILTLLPEPHPVFPDAVGLNSVAPGLPALYRTRMFFAHGDLPPEKLAYLEWALKKAFDSQSFQEFNEEKYMNLVDSYRGLESGKQFVAEMIESFRHLDSQGYKGKSGAHGANASRESGE